MIVVGLTGGIASGKSFVTKHLRTLKFPVHESDSVITNLYNSYDKNFVNFLFKNGFKNSLKKRKINKEAIREEIFNKKEKKTILEKYLHNEVRKKRNIFLKNNKKKDVVILDIPLLLENRLNQKEDIIIFIQSKKIEAIKRLKKRDNFNLDLLNKLKKMQLPPSYKKKKSHFIIKNNFTNKSAKMSVIKILKKIL